MFEKSEVEEPVVEDLKANKPGMVRAKINKRVKPRKGDRVFAGKCAIVWVTTLIELRYEAGLSIDSVSKALKMSRTGYWGIEQGCNLQLTSVNRICKFWNKLPQEIWLYQVDSPTIKADRGFPTEPAPAGYKYGWYSERQVKAGSGTFIYRHKDGRSIEVSETTDTPIGAGWTDRSYMGLVVSFENGGFIRKGREPAWKGT